jgi:hypothetical protein
MKNVMWTFETLYGNIMNMPTNYAWHAFFVLTVANMLMV